MKTLIYLNTFAEVVRAGGFSAAARSMDLPRSTVSLHVRQLELLLNARLLKRSTRSISLTEEGTRLFDACSASLRDLQTVLDRFSEESNVLQGMIRVTAPVDFPTDLLAGAIEGFRREHPMTQFELSLTNATLDFVDDRVDIAIGFAQRTDGGRVCKSLFPTHWHFCANADWIVNNGEPRCLEDVAEFVAPNRSLRRLLERHVLSGQTLPAGQITANNQLLIRDLVQQGAGVGLLPESLIAEGLNSGSLRTVLHDLVKPGPALCVEFPGPDDILPRTRAFAEHFATYLERSGHAPP